MVFADISDNVAVITSAADAGLVVLEGTPPIFGVTTGATPAGDATYTGGALTDGTNWTENWAYGLYEGNRGKRFGLNNEREHSWFGCPKTYC